jgi:CHASE3 domain sensor protein
MLETWTFGRRLAVGFALAGLILVIVAVTSYRTTSKLIENDTLVANTYQIRGELARLISALTDAETGQRGFVITGVDNYLEPYRAALTEIKGIQLDAQKLTADSPVQQRRLAAMSPLIDAKLAELKRTIDLRRDEGFDAAYKVVSNNEGKGYMDQLRVLVAEADRDEVELLSRRSQEANASAQLAMMITLWGGILGVVLVAAVGWFITSSLTRRIGDAVSQVQSSSAELQAAANQQATGSKEQSTAMTEITTTISELLATSRQIAESAQRVAQIAEQTASGARTGHGTVEFTQETISSIRRQVDQIVAHMLELGKKSPSRRTFSRSTRRSKPQVPATPAGVSASSPTKSASSPIASAGPPRRSARSSTTSAAPSTPRSWRRKPAPRRSMREHGNITMSQPRSARLPASSRPRPRRRAKSSCPPNSRRRRSNR